MQSWWIFKSECLQQLQLKINNLKICTSPPFSQRLLPSPLVSYNRQDTLANVFVATEFWAVLKSPRKEFNSLPQHWSSTAHRPHSRQWWSLEMEDVLAEGKVQDLLTPGGTELRGDQTRDHSAMCYHVWSYTTPSGHEKNAYQRTELNSPNVGQWKRTLEEQLKDYNFLLLEYDQSDYKKLPSSIKPIAHSLANRKVLQSILLPQALSIMPGI